MLVKLNSCSGAKKCIGCTKQSKPERLAGLSANDNQKLNKVKKKKMSKPKPKVKKKM